MKIKRDELWGYLFIICMMIFYSMDKWTEIRNGLMYAGLVLGGGGIIASIKMKFKTFLGYALFSIIPIISFAHAHDTRILVLLIAMLCGLTLEPAPVIRVMFYTKLVCYIIMLLTGGYGHINGVAVQGGILIMLYICMHERLDYLRLAGIILVYAALAWYTDSGAFEICMGAGIVLTILYQRFNVQKFFENVIVRFVFVIALFGNYFFAMGIGEWQMPYVGQWLPRYVNTLYLNMVNVLDVVMSYRLSLTKYSWGVFGVSLWGGNVDYSKLNLGENGYFNLDSGLIWLIQGGGIILTIGYMILTVLLMRYLMKNHYYHLVIAGIVIALWAVNEDVLLGIGTNFLTIFMGKAVVDYITERKAQTDGNT